MIHNVIIIPGLGDSTISVKLATIHWSRLGLTPVVHSVGWRKDQEHFNTKLRKLTSLIDRLYDPENKLSLVGTSAGSSAVMNAFMTRKDKIHRVVSVCGRLRQGTQQGYRSFKSKTATSISFKESVLMFEKNEHKLNKSDRKKIMTIRPIFDELVPRDTAILKDASNRTIYSIEHMFSIWMSLSFYKPLISFLKD